jgi:hypothetical protein
MNGLSREQPKKHLKERSKKKLKKHSGENGKEALKKDHRDRRVKSGATGNE